MKKFHQTRDLPYSQPLLWRIVSNVQDYGSFVPWCQACDILEKSESNLFMRCQMDIGFEFINTSFMCDVNLIPQTMVQVMGKSDTFHHMSTRWHLVALSEGETRVTFETDFSFRNPLFQMLAEKALGHVAPKVMEAFEHQAAKVST